VSAANAGTPAKVRANASTVPIAIFMGISF
jgi:hypothetical protein